MLVPYAFIFWIPTLASIALLIMLWSVGELPGRSPAIFAIWFLVALVLQYFWSGVWFWLGGVLLQGALATVLSVKWRMSVS